MDSHDSSQLIGIGEFARLGGVSIKALRLYGHLGLLHPAAIKSQSRYRLYSRAQLSKLHRILLLKNAGLPLAQIGSQLSHRGEAALSKLRDNLALRAEELQRQLAWVEAEIQAARNGATAAVPRVAIKRIPAVRVWSRRERIDSYDQADMILRDLGKQAPRPARLVSGAIWHDCGRNTKTIDCEAFWVSNRALLAPATRLPGVGSRTTGTRSSVPTGKSI
jgi:DNA-binding transcriptional MerR regulator